MKFSDLVQGLAPVGSSSLEAFPERNPELLGVSAIEQAQPQTLSYISGQPVGGQSVADQVGHTLASALVLPMSAEVQAIANARNLAWVASPQPRLLFAQAIAQFYQPFCPAPGIHPTAVIDPSAQLGHDVSVGAHAVIQAGVVIGSEVCIHPNVVIYPQARVGDRTIFYANCVIYERSQIGSDCIIHSGAAIGADGFGFVPTAEGFYKMPQSGYVILEDGVEVGCNSAVDRPALGVTRVGRQTKIDNLVQVAHGCDIGFGCALAGQVGLAGAVKLGDRVIMGGQAGAVDHVSVGSGVQVGAKTAIFNSIEPGITVSGTPAVPHALFLKIAAIWKQLPEMRQTLRRLQKQMDERDASKTP